MHSSPKGLLFAIYYPVIAVIGVPGYFVYNTANLAVIVILARGRCGLSGCIIYYLISMAVTDLMVIIAAVILNRIARIYFPFSFFSITPVCSLSFVIIYGVRDCSVWTTVTFTFDRFVAICCQKLRTKYCSKKTAVRVLGTVCVLSGVVNTPWYFTYESSFIIDGIPWFCNGKAILHTSLLWTAFDWTLIILTPCLPFILILLLNVLTVRHIIVANRSRRRLRAQSNGENQSDPEIKKRKKTIVLLFCISGSFILLYSLFFITILYVRLANVTYPSVSDSSNLAYMLDESGTMLQLLTSCINPFIYAGTQSQFRKELKNGVKYPMKLIGKLFN